MVQVYISRHQPGVKAHQINFKKGETITYQLSTGTVKAIINSEFMRHAQAVRGGYECIFADTGELGFADIDRIIGWSLGDGYA